MSTVDLTHPTAIIARLERIENDLATRQNAYENAAGRWYEAQREIGRIKAHALLTSTKTSITEKKAAGDLAAYDVDGANAEAEYESLKAVVRVLEQRAMIAMSLLKAQGRF